MSSKYFVADTIRRKKSLERGKIVSQGPCPNPECGSSDAHTVYETEDGSLNSWCYSCNTYLSKSQLNALKSHDGDITDHYNDLLAPRNLSKGSGSNLRNSTYQTRSMDNINHFKLESVEEALSHPIREIKERGLSHATCEHFGVRTGVDTRDGISPVYYLFPLHKDGELSGFKQKLASDKQFTAVGDTKSCDLFGAHCSPHQGKQLFITEGPEDAMALYQVLKEGSSFNWEPAVVALPNGTAAAGTVISRNIDFISGFDRVVLALDQDTAGKEATKEICKVLAGRVYVAKFPEKDPNEMLLKGKGEDLKWAVLTGARKYQPDGILNAKDCWDRYKDAKSASCYPYPSFLPKLNTMTYGVRPGTIVTVTAGTGIGKTQFLRELKYHYWKNNKDLKIADIALEEDIGDSIAGLISLHTKKRITLPDVEIPEDEEKRAFDELFTDNRFSLYDFFGGMDDDTLFSKLRYFAATGHGLIFLDHLSIVVSEYAAQGGERERIDTIMTKLAKFVKETGVVLFLVVHLKKSDSSGKPFEEGGVPSLDDLRGSSTLKQLSWDILALSRNQQHEDEYCSQVTQVTLLKCRFTGKTGVAGHYYFDSESGRLLEVDKPANY